MGDPAFEASPGVQRRVYLIAFLVSLGYGVFLRLAFGSDSGRPHKPDGILAVMSVAFLFAVPLAIGFIAAYLARKRGFLDAVLFTVLPSVAALATVLLLNLEGLICIFLWLPLYLILAAVGGLIAAAVLRLQDRRSRGTIAGAVLLLPFGLAPIEHAVAPPDELRRVETSIRIDADVAVVWREIAEVPQIREHEHFFAWSHLIGFPRPIAATLEGSGPGAVRRATFERGILFLEQVTLWRENERLEFTIHADPDSIPARALDEHVTVGGPYFDVLSGAYAIEVLPQGGVLLHLSSEHRLSTTFNAYAGFWTDFIMRDTQQYILEIIKRRCEQAAPR